MTVKKLRRVLRSTLEDLDAYEDDQEIKMVSNTYFLGSVRYFLGVSGYDGGYINLDNLVDEEDEDDE